MDFLPQDPAILVSSVNMLLRDHEYDTIEEICNCFDTDPAYLLQRMEQAGYHFDRTQNQFKAI